MKRILKVFFVVSMMMLMVAACKKQLPEIEKVDVVENIADGINSGVSKAILVKNEGKYQKADYSAEAHEILSSEDVTSNYRSEDGKKFVRIYALVTYGEYKMENENFIRVDGSKVVPTIITFSKNDNDTIDLINYQEVSVDEIDELFPEDIREEAKSIDSELEEELKEKEVKFVSKQRN